MLPSTSECMNQYLRNMISTCMSWHLSPSQRVTIDIHGIQFVCHMTVMHSRLSFREQGGLSTLQVTWIVLAWLKQNLKRTRAVIHELSHMLKMPESFRAATGHTHRNMASTKLHPLSLTANLQTSKRARYVIRELTCGKEGRNSVISHIQQVSQNYPRDWLIH
jgi:hypothetical protein